MLCDSLATAPLVIHQEFFEAVGGESQGLAAQLHQVGILEPGIGKAVLHRGTAPGTEPALHQGLLLHPPNPATTPALQDPGGLSSLQEQ